MANRRMRTRADKIIDGIIVTVVFLVVIICVAPLFNILALSFSGRVAINAGRVTFFPVDFTLEPWKALIMTQSIFSSMTFTIILTVTFTTLAMALTICVAYPLTKKKLHGRNAIQVIFFFTMYFGGGIIPEYILMKTLGLTNTMWVLVFPGVISIFNMIILKSFFLSLPDSLQEAALIDGANHLQILMRIVLPLSMPVLATLSLFYAVGRWNGFQDALIYITDPKISPIQLKLYQIINSVADAEIMKNEGIVALGESELTGDNIRSACILFATAPILVIYPFLQRHFIAGMTLGAVKE